MEKSFTQPINQGVGVKAQLVEVYVYGTSKQEFWVYRCGHAKRHFDNRRVREVLANNEGCLRTCSERDLRRGFVLHRGGKPERSFNIKWMREAPATEENAS
jgi:hypothetical protein